MPLVTGNQLRAARALANVDQHYVAAVAGVSVNTVRNMEAKGFDPITSGAVTVRKVQASLEALGVDFLGDDDEPGVRLQYVDGTAFQERDSGEWAVAVRRNGGVMLMQSVSQAREMADHAEQRGDARTAEALRRAADEAERYDRDKAGLQDS
jgi:transcriptional regulator with XRE-family HTH domain